MKRTTQHILPIIMLAIVLAGGLVGCSTKKNTAQLRWWKSFNARYNTYYNGSEAFKEGYEEKAKGNQDNFTEPLPLYMVGNKKSRDLGKGKFDRAIEKSEKTIKLFSIRQRPEWNKSRRKTQKDIEWLGRREYNPFLWRAWLMLGKSQFQKGEFEEAAATFSYMSRLYTTQPAINGRARAWLAKSYCELDWIYEAEDVITKMQRDTLDYRAMADWDYTYTDYYLRTRQFDKAAEYLRKSIKHEKRSYQRARMWFIMGQVQTELGNRDAAYKAYGKVIRQNPPYQTAFNARIAQTEVMAAGGNTKKMIRRLKSMARNDNNKDYLDQVYYAMGNIYMLQKDTAKAIGAYEKGAEKATRSGIEKGVLLLTLGNLYWQMEKYNDAQRCYGEAIGLLDKERKDYEELSNRSKVLDELVPNTDAIHLQDSLLELSTMPEKDYLEAIDRVIKELIKKEKEEKRKQQEAEAEAQLQKQGQQGNQNRNNQPKPQQQQTAGGPWYFYNPTAVQQGKQAFERQWGKRENVDDWQRVNRTVVNLNLDNADNSENVDSLENIENLEALNDSIASNESKETAEQDTAALDPHKREYYLAQIPFTDEQKEVCHQIIQESLFNSGVIFKDKLDNLRLSEKQLLRLTSQYPSYEKNDEAWYHMFLLYSRLGEQFKASSCLDTLSASYAESQWTKLVTDPYFADNARFGVHIEDSIYAATYNAFLDDRYNDVYHNAKLTEERFPMGLHRPKFLFIEGMSMLNEGRVDSCVARLTKVVQEHPQSEVAEMAGMIVKGVQEGRTLYGGKFDIRDIWSRRSMELSATDSTRTDTLSAERNANYLFMLAYQPDSVNQNQLLFEMARYNFTNFMVRSFDLNIEPDGPINRMLVTGFLSFDEALQYARMLYQNERMMEAVKHCRRYVISEHNLALIGTRYSYTDYEAFYDSIFSPLPVSEEELLFAPELQHVLDAEDFVPETTDTEEEGGTQGSPEGQGEMDDFESLGLPRVQENKSNTEESEFPGLPEPPVTQETPQKQEETDDLGLPPVPTPKPTEKTDDFDLDTPAPITPPTRKDIHDDLDIDEPAPLPTPKQKDKIDDFDDDFYR